MKVLLPDLKVQSEFEAKINNITIQQDLLESEIQSSEQLFQSLLQRAFKGQLVS